MKVVEAKIIIPIDIIPIDGTGISPVTKIEAALYECEEILRESLGTKVAFAKSVKS